MTKGHQTSAGSSPPTTVRLQNVAQSYGQSAALMAAVEIGVFTAISNVRERMKRWRRPSTSIRPAPSA